MLIASPRAKPGPPAGERCLVLGAGGFIGTNLCLALRNAGAEVCGLGRGSAPPPPLRGRIAWRQADAERLADPEALLSGHDYLFDLVGAGLPNSSNDDPAQAVADGLPGRIRLLDACRRTGVRRILFASSGGTVYGAAGHMPLAEDAPTDPISAYGIGKLAMEKYLALFRHLHGVEYRVLRIGNAYGRHQHPGRGQGLVAAVLDRLLRDEPIPVWGNGAQVRDYVHAADVVQAFELLAFDHDGSERVFNVGGGVGRSVADVIADAGRVLGRRPRLSFKPGRSADVPMNVLDPGRLARETGWCPRIAWEDGLRDTAAWLSERTPAEPHAAAAIVM